MPDAIGKTVEQGERKIAGLKWEVLEDGTYYREINFVDKGGKKAENCIEFFLEDTVSLNCLCCGKEVTDYLLLQESLHFKDLDGEDDFIDNEVILCLDCIEKLGKSASKIKNGEE